MTDTAAIGLSRNALNVHTYMPAALSLAWGHCVNGLLNRRGWPLAPRTRSGATRPGKIGG